MLTLIMKRRGSVPFKGHDWRVLKIAREQPARDEGGRLDMPCSMHRARQPMGGNRRCKPAYPRANNKHN
jgi:hypothetical protein